MTHRLTTLILLTILALLGTSCQQMLADYHPAPESVDDDTIELSYTLSDPQLLRALPTEPGQDRWNENKVDNLHVMLYEGETQRAYFTDAAGVTIGTGQLTRTPTSLGSGTATAVIERVGGANPLAGKSYRLIMIANYSESLRGLSLTQLRNRSYEHPQVKAQLEAPSTSALSAFLMDGEITTPTLTWAANNRKLAISNTVQLRRALSRVDVRVTKIDIADPYGQKFTVQGADILLFNGSYTTSLTSGLALQDAVSPSPAFARVSFDANAYRTLQPGTAGSYAADFPFYVAEDNWKKLQGSDVFRPQVSIRLKLRDSRGKETETYYSLPIYYLAPYPGMPSEMKQEIGRIGRNKLYRISTAITELGEPEPGAPLELNPMMSVEDWDPAQNVDGNLAKAHYLIVHDRFPVISFNEAGGGPRTKTIDIEYTSDLPLDPAVVQNFTASWIGYDNSGTEMPKEGGKLSQIDGRQPFRDISVQLLPQQNKIRVTGVAPDNYVPWTITIRAQQLDPSNTTPLSDNIRVTLYPSVYVTAERSTGMSGKDANGDDIYLFWYSLFGQHVGGVSQTNNTIYKVHTNAPVTINGTQYYIGDPTLGADNNQTDRREEANRIISPEFVIATHWAVSPPLWQYVGDSFGYKWTFGNRIPNVLAGIRQDGDNMYGYYYQASDSKVRYRHYNNALSRAMNHFEHHYGKAGVTGGWHSLTRRMTVRGGMFVQSRPSDFRQITLNRPDAFDRNWRLPSTAELLLVSMIQREPKSAVKALLLGTNYWVAQDNTAVDVSQGQVNRRTKESTTNEKGAPFGVNVRPIFDTYMFEERTN